MTAGFQISSDAVVRHAAALDEAAEGMQTARSAVREVTMDSLAYGQLCQFLPALLSPLFMEASEALGDAVEALTESALKLRATASSMNATDASGAARVNNAGGPDLELPL
ncbi:type VII secretion target [Actinoplanes sp. NPDC051633]|uniref:type VII secretion target n=1 Tax=Actinoplanes sp. NPDC051633 TaxID=3155670 RepID=UPI00343BC237